MCGGGDKPNSLITKLSNRYKENAKRIFAFVSSKGAKRLNELNQEAWLF